MFHESAFVYRPNHDGLSQSHSSSNFDSFNKGTNGLNRHVRKNSLVVGQKLRESKWFGHDELNILCAVVESGFILQRKNDACDDYRGIALWASGYEKSKNPDYITIYTVIQQKGVYKVQSSSLLHFWDKDSTIKINNLSDQTNTPNTEEIIRNQIKYAEKHSFKWHNSEHFTYWCRYGTPQKNYKTKQMSESLKWGNLGLNAGLLLLKRNRHNSDGS